MPKITSLFFLFFFINSEDFKTKMHSTNGSTGFSFMYFKPYYTPKIKADVKALKIYYASLTEAWTIQNSRWNFPLKNVVFQVILKILFEFDASILDQSFLFQSNAE